MNGCAEEFMKALQPFMKVTKPVPLAPVNQTGPIGLNPLTDTQILEIQRELHLRQQNQARHRNFIAKPTRMKKTNITRPTLSPSVNAKIESICNSSSDVPIPEVKKPAKTVEWSFAFHYTVPKLEQERDSSPDSNITMLNFSSEWMREGKNKRL
ncbi:hypothetical protein Bca52824_009870 [Brassica carinata]|uniref:Uncharacterized protein n=1 Tax=Brassica carinata TaxID=52824 RepID=A0A8X8BA63_BRACI|nr:hypothetical protein Bca52824_009867 [Brassica carinata]KAG2327142.1 hypothetical protein Bca52824_009870 [Brassica carinata]